MRVLMVCCEVVCAWYLGWNAMLNGEVQECMKDESWDEGKKERVCRWFVLVLGCDGDEEHNCSDGHGVALHLGRLALVQVFQVGLPLHEARLGTRV